jgi:hypothetical protein
MKVIAKIDSNRVLCEVDITELAMLHGYRSSYDTGFKKDSATEVGAECNLKKMVTTSQFIRGVRPQTLKKTKEQLEETIKQIDSAMETIAGLEIFNILSEDKQIGEE